MYLVEYTTQCVIYTKINTETVSLKVANLYEAFSIIQARVVFDPSTQWAIYKLELIEQVK